MYRLVGVGGRVRGKSYELLPGDNILGRGGNSSLVINVEGISREHLVIQIVGDKIFLEDLKSANGSIVNQQIVQKIYLKVGDVITLPNAIFTLAKAKKVKTNDFAEMDNLPKGKEATMQNNYDDVDRSETPGNLLARLKYIFRFKIMPVVFNFNKNYEWHSMLTALTILFIVANSILTLGPIIQDTSGALIKEIALRGSQYVDEVERTNSVLLSRMAIDQIKTGFLDESRDITSYLLFDNTGRVIRPIEKLNTYISDPVSVELMNWVKSNPDNLSKTFIQKTTAGEIAIGKSLRVFNVELQKESLVGYALIKFRPTSLVVETSKNRRIYLESIIVSCLLAIFFVSVIYYLTMNPVFELKFKLEQFLNGRGKDLNSEFKMEELGPLRKTMQGIILRLNELINVNPDVQVNNENDEIILDQLKNSMDLMKSPCLILDGQKNVKYLNGPGEELLGIRENLTSGQSLFDNLRDQGLAATIMELLQKSEGSMGRAVQDQYEIAGNPTEIFVMSALGKDGSARGYLATFYRT
jgi:hypothetical protein